MDASLSSGYELRFDHLFRQGRAYAFPCDAAGHVSVETLSERARDNYALVQSLVGREYAAPVVELQP